MIDPVLPKIELLRDLRRLRIDGSEQVIGARAFDVLAYLDAHSGRVVTKAELLEHVWADLNVEESNLTVQIAALRKLIGARAIATVPGVGYQLTLSAISTLGTVWRDCVAEGLRLIFTPVGVEDEKEPRDDEGPCRAGREGHSACDAQTAFVRGEDPDRAIRPSW